MSTVHPFFSHFRRSLVLCALIGLLPACAMAAETLQRAVFVDQPAVEGLVFGIDPQWNVKLQVDNKVTVVPADDLIYWGQYRDRETGPQLVLSSGGLLRSDPLELTAETITVGDATGLGRSLWDESALPRSAVRGILLQPPADAMERDQLIARVRAYEQAGDLLLLTGGETVPGRLVEAPRGGRFLPEDETPSDVFKLVRAGVEGPLTVPASKVVAVFFARVKATQSKDATASPQLGFSDGSLLSVEQVSLQGDTVQFHLAGGGILSAPLDQPHENAPTIWRHISWLRSASPRVAYLSDLPPIGYKHIPLLTLDWPYGSDRNDLGGALRTDGAVWSKGVGMHPISRLAYELDGRYRQFQAELALDAAAGRHGSVVFKVLVERQPNQWSTAFESPVIRGGGRPVPVSIDVEDVRRMALIVEYADRADERDHANWLMARLVQ